MCDAPRRPAITACMEAIVHLDRPAAMPSQSQMAYAQRTTLHNHRDRGPLQESLEHYQRFLNRPSQGGPGEVYKPPQQGQGQLQGQGSQQQGHSQGPSQQQVLAQQPTQGQQRASQSPAAAYPTYPGMRYIQQSAYAPPPAPTPPLPVSYRDTPYGSRTAVRPYPNEDNGNSSNENSQ